MKVFRDIMGAVMVGLLAGFVVSVFSYYHDHKEGGVKQTMLAVVNSFDEVAKAYSDSGESMLLSDMDAQGLDDEVLEAFEQVENGDVDTISQAVFNSIFNGNNQEGMSEDVLAMDGEDGNLDEGAPYSGIMRFHVRANSDTEEDQELKLAVKEDVVNMLKPLLEDCTSVAESKSVIVSNLQNIYTTAVNTIMEQGYDYPVKVYVTQEEFPAKTYGDLTFPEGKYQALRVDIGAAKGQNWWCVMYPPLCFIDESTAVVTEEGKEQLKQVLTAEEYENLFAYGKTGGEQDVEIKAESWLYNWLTK